MEEKGRPWLSKLGVATETTGVVSAWLDWEAPRRWVLFCRRKVCVVCVAGGGGRACAPRPGWGPCVVSPTAPHPPPQAHMRGCVHGDPGTQVGEHAWVQRGGRAGPGREGAAGTRPARGARARRGACLRVSTHTCGAVSSICR